MRLFKVSLTVLVAASLPCAATAQAAPKKHAAAKKKAAPKVNPAIAIYAAMPLADKMAIQTDLMWTGDYNGVANGEFNERAIAGVKATVMQALDAGVVDVILKPRMDTAQFLHDSAVRICDVVKGAAAARLPRRPSEASGPGEARSRASTVREPSCSMREMQRPRCSQEINRPSRSTE